jgi:hypothetical protein
MNPLMDLALAHPEQPPRHDLEGVCFQVDQDTQQPILGRWQRRILVSRVPAGGAQQSIEAPLDHIGLENGLKGWDQAMKFIHDDTG